MASLSMGAEGETFDEINNGMHLNDSKSAIAARFLRHFHALNDGRGESTLTIVNQMYVQKDYAIKTAFQNNAVKYFESGIESLDFADSANAANAINSFVSNKTKDKIRNLIEPDVLDSSTGLVLINAIHFKGNWKHEFDEYRSFKGDFYVNKHETKNVTFMKDQHLFRYVEINKLNAKAIELKFKNSQLALIAILPNDPDGLPALERKVQSMKLRKLLKRMRLECVAVTLPKFKIEYKVDLQNVLNKVSISYFRIIICKVGPSAV